MRIRSRRTSTVPLRAAGPGPRPRPTAGACPGGCRVGYPAGSCGAALLLMLWLAALPGASSAGMPVALADDATTATARPAAPARTDSTHVRATAAARPTTSKVTVATGAPGTTATSAMARTTPAPGTAKMAAVPVMAAKTTKTTAIKAVPMGAKTAVATTRTRSAVAPATITMPVISVLAARPAPAARARAKGPSPVATTKAASAAISPGKPATIRPATSTVAKVAAGAVTVGTVAAAAKKPSAPTSTAKTASAPATPGALTVAKAAPGRGSVTPVPRAPVTPGRTGAVAPAGKGQMVVAAMPLEDHVTYQYNALGRRDPFQSLMEGEFVGADVGGDAPPDVGGLKVVGIVWGGDDQFAMVEDVRGNSYVLRRGDKVMNGFVEGLKRDAMLVNITVDGQSQSVLIPITRKGDKANANR